MFIPDHSTLDPFDSLLDPSSSKSTDWQDSTVAHHASLFAFEDLSDKAFFDSHDLQAVFAILFVGQHQDRNAYGVLVLEHTLQDRSALV